MKPVKTPESWPDSWPLEAIDLIESLQERIEELELELKEAQNNPVGSLLP